MPLKKSRFFSVYERDGIVCLYNSLTMQCVYCKNNVYYEWNQAFQLSQDFKGSILELNNSLCEANLIIPEEENEDELFSQIKKQIFDGVHIRVMVLQMTDYCNLHCKYCFIEGAIPKDYVRKEMPIDTAKSAVDKFISILERDRKNIHSKPSIVFYGGEPLANWIVVKQCLDYIDNYQKSTDAIQIDKVLITNGTLITDSIAKDLASHQVIVSVSLDGVKEAHDYNRIDENGNGSFEKAVRGYWLLKKYGIEPGIACVLSKHSLPYAMANYHFFKDTLHVKGFGMNHVSIIPNLTYYDPDYEEKYADKLLEIQENIQSDPNPIYERRMNHKINCFLNGKLMPSDCTGCGEQISVSTEGDIGICQGYMGSRKTFEHTVFEKSFFPDDNEIFKEWSMRSPLNLEDCQNCPALATCGGGCPRNADMINGTIWKPDKAFCHFALKAQEWMIWKNMKPEMIIG
ncbi:MAG: SPASM domain-containing protein [Lactimicrobium massiliense]|nr:radical SAM protein [Lactimicrobium massiliense]MDD6229849.1 SPASM domain-containing protein [Lactimicrobium massiliense]MDD6559856.1 SPASM domain-containing protein [Lactimicrobium massiliense]